MEGEIKRGFMSKKSVGKSTIKIEKYNNRWFILYPSALKYMNGALDKGPKDEKGAILTRHIKVVEEVENGSLDGKKNVFQVVYENNAQEHTLYVVAQTAEDKKEWIDSIRTACKEGGAHLRTKYHPRAFTSRHGYQCCLQKDRNAPGCKDSYYDFGPGAFGGSKPSGGDDIKSVKPPMSLLNLPGAGSPSLSSLSHGETPETGGSGGLLASPVVMRPPIPTEPQRYVIALFDFRQPESGDLRLARGEDYGVLDDTRENWWYAVNKNGERGYIPANFVKDKAQYEADLDKFEWYFSDMMRSTAEGMLRAEGREGAYLVRNSSQGNGTHTLCILTNDGGSGGHVKHYHIKKNSSGLYYLNESHAFDTISKLIKYHQSNPGGLATRLRYIPSSRTSYAPPEAPGLGHDMYEIEPTDLVLKEELGKGQFGRVNLGIYKGRKQVAVKTMKPGAMSEDAFIDEARTMAHLMNKHLVQLFGVVTKHRPIFIVTEFMKHGALLDYLRKNKMDILSRTSHLLDMCFQVCQGMQYLEEQSIIHRDLAARNCLVGEDYIVKVADFGLARFVIDDEYQSSAGSRFPVKWAPPEVLGYSRFSSKSDIWAFGVLLWEVFSGGESPYGRKSNQEVVDLVVNRNYRLRKPSQCPDEIARVMQDCWNKTAAQRPGFPQLVYDLGNFTNKYES